MVLFPDEVHVSKTMRRILKNKEFKVTYNTCFTDVILNCKRIKRDGQHGTWITNEMLEAYIQLHEEGFAESVEVWVPKAAPVIWSFVRWCSCTCTKQS